jgi:hypothetical protein
MSDTSTKPVPESDDNDADDVPVFTGDSTQVSEMNNVPQKKE